MELTAEQIQQNWIDLEETIKTFIEEPRRSQLLDFYSQYSDRIMMMLLQLNVQRNYSLVRISILMQEDNGMKNLTVSSYSHSKIR